ncbi:hypothetical protein RB195_008073 [Necator americanus]|uniref:Uncharacterized protein n=1 Tax=Necator americanus TaxID=51031 RepID=A0ABR1C1G9_NECAM
MLIDVVRGQNRKPNVLEPKAVISTSIPLWCGVRRFLFPAPTSIILNVWKQPQSARGATSSFLFKQSSTSYLI